MKLVRTKKVLVFMIVLYIVTCCSFNMVAFSSDEDFITRKDAVEMLLIAADDYNPKVIKSDVIKGYEDGQLHEERLVTKAEALIMLKRAFGNIPEIKGFNKYVAFPKEEFTDIPDWAKADLKDVFDLGIVGGNGKGEFSPNDKITKPQMKTLISRVYKLFGTNLKDNFYATINKDALDNTVIPDGKAITGTLYNDITADLLQKMIIEIDETTCDKNSKEYKIKTLYNNYLNKEARNKQGYEPIKEYLEAIDNVKSVSEFVNTKCGAGYLSEMFFSFNVSVDTKDSNQYVNTFSTISISSKDMYEGKMEKQKEAYLKYISTLVSLIGENDVNAKKIANDIFDFGSKIANASLSLTDHYNVEKTYNEYSLDQIDSIFKNVNIYDAFFNTGLKNKDKFIVSDVGAMEELARLFVDDNLDVLKNYAKVRVISQYAGYMSDDFKNAVDSYNQEIYGIKGKLTDEYYATQFVSSSVASYVGEIYGEKYVTDKMAEDLTLMVDDIIEIYRKRIKNLDWMTETTKEKALKKLDTMNRKLLKPDEWEKISLDDEEIKSYEDGGNLVQNIVTIGRASRKDMYEYEGKKVDKTAWIAPPHMVNALYNPSFNEIIFPVAFLQIPVIYDENASYEANLGGIGFVVGHELSHAFDSNGSQYDENGNATNWWTKEDAQTFKTLCNKVVSYYEGQEEAPGITINSTNTLTENIADLGAISVITELASKKEDFNYKEMYERYAKVWFTVATRGIEQTLAYTDVHSPASVRVNRVLQSIDKFYEVYNITENDGMWVNPEDRVSIW